MSKYDRLGEYLKSRNEKMIEMTFEEIEEVLGFKLSKSFHKYSSVWIGTAEGSPGQVAKRVWQAAGYNVLSIELVTEEVVFEKIQDNNK